MNVRPDRGRSKGQDGAKSGAGQSPGRGKARGGAKAKMEQSPGRGNVRGRAMSGAGRGTAANSRLLWTGTLDWLYFPLQPGSDASSLAFARPVAPRRCFPRGPPSWRSKTKRLWLGWHGGGTHSRGGSGLGARFCLALPPAASCRGRGMEEG